MAKITKLNNKLPSYLKFIIFAVLLAALALNAGCGNSSSKSNTNSSSTLQSQNTTSQSTSQAPQTDSKSNTKLTYTKDIEPILSDSCVRCHSANGSAAGLPLDSYANVMKNVTSGNRANSELIKSVDGGSMSEKLNSDQLKTLKTWVELGAVQ